jgi:hypothetical protein
MDTLPSGVLLRNSTFFPLSGQRGITPAFGYGAPHPGARGTSTLLNNVLLSTHYRPVRLPYGAASRVMHSPRAWAALPATPPGLPGSSTDLSPCAVPNHPGEPDGCSLPLLPRRCQASSSRKAGADWPLPLYITRPYRVHLCYGSRVRLARLRHADCSVPRSLGPSADGLNGQLTGQAPFSLQDQPGLSWRSIHRLSCMRPTNTRNIPVTASYPWPVLAS